jgi:hypothetical protein
MSKTVFRIKIELGNSAMMSTEDLCVALNKLIPRVESIADSGEEKRILDANGQPVGTVGFYLEH